MKAKQENDFSGRKQRDTIHVRVPINVNLSSGLLTGIFISVFFHPVDRAFYLRNTDKKPQYLFAPKYWKTPFSGLRNTVYQRILSNSVYFTMQGELNSRLQPWMQQNQYSSFSTRMAIGSLAGSMTGFFSNGSYAVKYYSFRHGPRKKPLENAIRMWQKGGGQPFFKGIVPGVMRDSIFGVTYELLNLVGDTYLLNNLDKSSEDGGVKRFAFFGARFFSAAVATTLSSPFNYVRNIQFNSPPEKGQPHCLDVLCNVWQESNKYVKECPDKKLLARMGFFKEKFMVGPGTIRAAAGMGLGQALVNYLRPAIQNLDIDADNTPKKL
jgi:hypothetical protein